MLRQAIVRWWWDILYAPPLHLIPHGTPSRQDTSVDCEDAIGMAMDCYVSRLPVIQRANTAIIVMTCTEDIPAIPITISFLSPNPPKDVLRWIRAYGCVGSRPALGTIANS